MPKKSGKSPVKGLLNAAKSHASEKTTVTEFTDPPPGIKNGIAKLIVGKVGEYSSGKYKGNPFLRLAGTIVSPDSVTVQHKEWDGDQIVYTDPITHSCKGLQTSVMFPLCETKKSIDDNVDAAFAMLRSLGGEDCTESIEEASSEEEVIEAIQSLLDILVKEGIFFRFSTSEADPNEEYPNPTVWQNWGLATSYSPEESQDVEEDEEDEGDDDGEEQEDETEEEEESEEEPEEKKETSTGDDLDALAEAADESGDEDSDEAVRLKELALEAGVEEDDVDEAPSWSAVAGLIKKAQKKGNQEDEEESEDEEEENETIKPEKEDVYGFRPEGKKKDIAVEVTAVFKGKETCNVKDEKGKTYRGVPWTKLKEWEDEIPF